MQPTDTVRLTVVVPAHIAALVRQAADAEDRPVSAWLRRAIQSELGQR